MFFNCREQMNIWLIQIGEALPIESDVSKLRTAMLSDELVKRGYYVLWWASAFDHLKKKWVFDKDSELSINNGLTLKVLKGCGYKRNISLSRFVDHRIIARKFRKLAPKMPKPDIIVTSMPSHDMAYEAVMFAKKRNIPILVDIRDQWPDIFLTYVPQKFRRFFKIIFYKNFLMIKKVTQEANGLIAVTNTFLEWGLQYAERKRILKDRVFYLGYKRKFDFNKSIMSTNIFDNLRNRFVVTFIGTFAHYHNPSILLDCAVKLLDKNICFVLAGDGELFKQIKNKASSMPNIVLPGWLNQDEISILLQHSHVGVCPARQHQKTDLFPNKAFAYLSAGLPVISAFQGDLKEIIEKYQIGFYYPPGNVDVLINYIKKLYESPDLYKTISENARKVFDERFDADKIYLEYAEHIEKVAENYKKGK